MGPGEKQHVNNKIFEAGAKLIGQGPQPSDIERLVQRGESFIKAVRAHAQSIKDEARAGGHDTAGPGFRKQIQEDVSMKIADFTTTLNEDELVVLMCQTWTVQILRDIL